MTTGQSRFMRKISIRLILALVAAVGLLGTTSSARQARDTVPALPAGVSYLLPIWPQYSIASETAFANAVSQLRTRIGEGPRAKIGFSTYVFVSMDNWNIDT